MKQCDIDRAVARATGESVSTIKRLGFLIADPEVPFPDPECPCLGGHVLDWDEWDGIEYRHTDIMSAP